MNFSNHCFGVNIRNNRNNEEIERSVRGEGSRHGGGGLRYGQLASPRSTVGRSSNWMFSQRSNAESGRSLINYAHPPPPATVTPNQRIITFHENLTEVLEKGDQAVELNFMRKLSGSLNREVEKYISYLHDIKLMIEKDKEEEGKLIKEKLKRLTRVVDKYKKEKERRLSKLNNKREELKEEIADIDRIERNEIENILNELERTTKEQEKHNKRRNNSSSCIGDIKQSLNSLRDNIESEIINERNKRRNSEPSSSRRRHDLKEDMRDMGEDIERVINEYGRILKKEEEIQHSILTLHLNTNLKGLLGKVGRGRKYGEAFGDKGNLIPRPLGNDGIGALPQCAITPKISAPALPKGKKGKGKGKARKPRKCQNKRNKN